MLTEETFIGSITRTPTGHIEVRQDTVILKDGEPIGTPVYHRHVLEPGADLTGQDPEVVAIATVVWTPERVAAQEARIAAAQLADAVPEATPVALPPIKVGL